jgi:hypothetical protein
MQQKVLVIKIILLSGNLITYQLLSSLGELKAKQARVPFTESIDKSENTQYNYSVT